MAKNRRQKVPKSDFQSQFSTSKMLRIFLKKILLKNINLGAPFLSLSILWSIKIKRLLFLKFFKNLPFFDSYFWQFNKSEEKIKAIFVISAIIFSIWNVFIKFYWHDEKVTIATTSRCLPYIPINMRYPSSNLPLALQQLKLQDQLKNEGMYISFLLNPYHLERLE